MTVRSRRRFHVVLWTLCCLLVSQWALAAHACAAIERAGQVRSPVSIELDLAAQARESSGHDCHDLQPDTAGLAAGDSAICIEHCADESAATGGALTVATAALAPPAVIRTLVADAPVPVQWEQAPACADAAPPPLSILYGVFLS